MSDHDFEKRVQQKMDELKFTPSDAVWKAVEKEIRKERPRRRGWVLIPILVLGLGVAGYFTFIRSSNTPGTSSESITENSKKEATSEVASNSTESSLNNSETEPGENQPSTTDKRSASSEDKSSIAEDKSSITENKSTIAEHKSTISGDDATSITASANSIEGKANSIGNKDKVNPTTGKRNLGDDITHSKKDKKSSKEEGLASTKNNTSSTKEKPRSNNDKASSNEKGLILSNDNRSPKDDRLTSNNDNASSQKDKLTSDKDRTTSINDRATSTENKPVTNTERQIATGTKPAQEKTTGVTTNKGEGQLNGVARKQDAPAALPARELNAEAKPVTGSAISDLKTSELQPKMDSGLAATPTIIKSKKKKTPWEWGVTVSGGLSNTSEDPLTGVLKSSPTADALSASAPLNGSVFAPNPAGLPPARPSKVKAGPYFSIGGFVHKQISKTFAFSAGLQYSQYNTIIEVGYRVDSSRLVNNGSQVMNVARYYRADDNSKFSNRYHFLELPLSIQTRITGNKSIPIFWNAGITLSRLIGSDALLFDSGTGVYYKDKSALNKTQFGLATGFTLGLFGKSKTPVLVGPSLKYNTSRMFGKDIAGDKHLISAGLDLKIFLNKK